MRHFPLRWRRIRLVFLAILALAFLTRPTIGVRADDAKPPAQQKEATPKKLTGAELYAIHCTRCHLERSPAEFDPAQWQTLLTHMQVRANLPAKQAREILKYLQDNAGH